MRTRRREDRAGLAMVAVLLVLLALLVLCTPFLLTVGNTDKASVNIVDRATADLALDAATTHAQGLLGASHPGVDTTPWYDSEGELEVTNAFDQAFLNPRDEGGVMWDLDVSDIAGRIDINTAPPQLLANMIGGVARVVEPVEAEATEARVNSTAGFLPVGFFWAGRELIGYTGIDGNTFTGLLRGLGVELDEEGNATKCGAAPPHALAIGAVLLAERAFAVSRWRTRTPDQELATFDSIEQVSNAQGMTMGGSLGEEALVTFTRIATPFGGVGAGPQWQNPVRVIQNIEGGQTDCTVNVADGRFFNPGTTVQITDGQTTEMGVVISATPGALTLWDPLVNEYAGFGTVVRALARRPVNINTASREVLRALMTNLKLRRNAARITEGEANELAEIILVSRPFSGFEDFVRRVVLPAAGFERLPKDAPVVPEAFAHHREEDKDGVPAEIVGFIDQADALALYKNALNANDNELAFSTLPFSFVSRDVYEMQVRAAVNKKSGVERVSTVREQVERIVPQRPLIQRWHRQSDFDLHGRFERIAPGWITGPATTTRYDYLYKSEQPSRSRAHLGPYDTQRSQDPLSDTPSLTFASREDEGGWLQPWAARMEFTGDSAGRVLHFDDETRDSEGRYLPDGVVARVTNDGDVGWSDSGLMAPMAFATWLKPMALEDGARFLDVGGPFNDSDRVSLLFEEGALVFRMLDAAGDHPDSAFEEFAELRYPFSGTDGPGIGTDTWVHVAVTASGNRPDQMTMLIDGKWWAKTPGLTRLTGGLAADASEIAVDSTEGFPDVCVLRIGNELIEAVRSGPRSFSAVHQVEGEYAGFGGRAARELFIGSGEMLVNVGVAKAFDHPEGAAVQHYGYALPLESNVPGASAVLPSNLGLFSVARVAGIVKGGSVKDAADMEPIQLLTQAANVVTLGHGMDGLGDDVEALVLAPADPNGDATKVMEGFSERGGYAAILSLDFNPRITDLSNNNTSQDYTKDINGTRLGGIEVIYYSGWSDNQLTLQRRGDQVPELKNLADANVVVAGRGAFIFHWGGSDISIVHPYDEQLTRQTMVIPISLGISGGSGAGGFLPAQAGQSQLAQITRVGEDTPFTEWVRYDELVTGQLVRDDPFALDRARAASHAGLTIDQPSGTVGRPGGGGGGGGLGGGGGGGGGSFLTRIDPPAAGRTGSAPSPGPAAAAYWDNQLGMEEDTDYVVTHATRTQFQFRGVFGTSPHEHPGGTTVLPVWQARLGDFAGFTPSAWPGRMDYITLFDEDPSSPGWPAQIHFVHRPREHIISAWQEVQGGEPLSAEHVATGTTNYTGISTNAFFVALRDASPIPLAAGLSSGNANSGQLVFDTRLWPRLTKFPSGERPRDVVSVLIGGDFRGAGGVAVPSAVVDEVEFGSSRFGQSSGIPQGTIGAQLVLAVELEEGERDLEVAADSVLVPMDLLRLQDSILNELPPDGGVLRIGDELLYYESYDEENDLITIAELGRGLLGTEPRNHAAGEAVTPMPSIRAGILSAGISAEDSALPLVSLIDFPPRGTVLIDDELIHYDYVIGNALHMARGSSEPGVMNGRTGGLFRGRFGTVPEGHAALTPVILFPFRYWDRWAEKADAPEMHYFGMHVDQPTAFWRSIFWEAEEAKAPGPRLGMLLRTDPREPWDADPDQVPGLEVLWDGTPKEDANPIGTQADRLEWRFFVKYERGSFDPELGTANGWKMVPRVRRVGVEYLGPGMVLRRVER